MEWGTWELHEGMLDVQIISAMFVLGFILLDTAYVGTSCRIVHSSARSFQYLSPFGMVDGASIV